jgi:ACT domain-containing protein
VSKFKIYEAGKMSGLTLEQMNSWRIKAKELFKQYSDDILTINPVDFYNFEMDRSTYTEHEVKFFDLYQVKNSNIILLNLDYPDSIGTAIEVHEAHDNWKIPVIAFGGENVFVHPWIELSITKRCKTLEEAVEHIIEFYFVNW